MELNKVYETKILRQNNEGEGIGKVEDMIVFIPYALPSELVEVKIDKINKNFAYGHIEKILQASSDRVNVKCPYFEKCGGCNLLHQKYDKQLEFKKEKIISIFKKICNIDIDLEKVNSYNEFNYRNKVVFKVESDKIGFYKSNTNELIDIEKCIISNKKINEYSKIFRKFIKENKDNNIHEIMIRVCNDDVMISMDNINDNIKDKFIDEFKNIVKSIYIKNKLCYGEESLKQDICNLKFNVSPKSFFQINIETASKLYECALKNIDNENIVLDLYSGTGTITSLLSQKCNKVIGIEEIKSAVDDANKNIKENNIGNVEFLCGKVEDLIDKIKSENIDTIVMDPPRGGSDRKTLKNITLIKPNKIIYISCNPVTLARDYNVLKDYYELDKIYAFDMFPNTYHVECVCALKIK